MGRRAALEQTARTLEQGIEQGLHLGGQLYVSRQATVEADLAFGENRPGEPMLRDHLMLWLSATKPVTAAAVAQLWERGELSLDDPVARFIPEFARGGKEGVTVRHVLTHTSGFRMLGIGWPEAGWEEILGKICERRLEPRWEPGEKAGYHLSSSWFVLGELIRRLDGRPVERYLRQEIFEPLGMDDCWVGMPEERYRSYTAALPGETGRIALTWRTDGDDDPEPHPWHTAPYVTRPSPGGNGRGPIHQLGRFYEAMLAAISRAETSILSPQTVEAMTSRHRAGMYDHTFSHVLDWGLGFIVDSNQHGAETVPYGYGPHCSRRTFGHSGYRSVAAFADPRHRLVVALAVNGTPSARAHEARTRAVLAAVYEDLGLAKARPEAGS